MNVDAETISLATSKRYTDFSDKIKEIFDHKMKSHPVYKSYTDNVDRLKTMKDTFVNFNDAN